LIQVVQQTVKTCRNLSYVGSLFLNFLLVRRLGDNEAVPHNKSGFCLPCILSTCGSRKYCRSMGPRPI
jgi:hypothetical protein